MHSILRENARKGVVAGFLRYDMPSTVETERGNVNGEIVEIISLGSRDTNDNGGEEDQLPRDWYPFDPYVLPRSKRFVMDCFSEYESLDPEEHDDMDTDGEDTDGSEDMDEEDL